MAVGHRDLLDGLFRYQRSLSVLVAPAAPEPCGEALRAKSRATRFALDRLPDPRVRIGKHSLHGLWLGGLTTGCRRGTLTAISFATAITAVVGGLGAAFFLFRIDLPLTLLIFVSAGLAALLLYPLTLRGVASAKIGKKPKWPSGGRFANSSRISPLNEPATSLEVGRGGGATPI